MVRPDSRSRLPLRRGLVLVLGLFALECMGCATLVTVPRMKPAEVNLAGYRRVAVGGVYGEGGDPIGKQLTESLFATKRFDVLDRGHLDEVMKEQDLAASGAISDETAVSIGQIIGSAALVVGEVGRHHYDEELRTQKKICKKTVGKGKDKKTKEYPCVDYTRVAGAQVEVMLKLLDTETGQVLAVKNLSAQRSKQVTKTDREPMAFKLRDRWLGECRDEVVTEFMKVIAPYQVMVRVELLDDGDLPQLETGNNFAKIGNWTEAAGQYRLALQQAEQDPGIDPDTKAKALYNLGVALGYSGQYDEGISYLENAFALDPHERTMGEIQKVRTFKADDERLREQAAGAAEAS